MIQRKQSVFLLLAFIASVVCLCLRIGDIEPAGMGVGFKLYNIMLDKGATSTIHRAVFWHIAC